MRAKHIWLLGMLLIVCGCTQDSQHEKTSESSGKQILFDGNDTSKWVGAKNEPCPWPVEGAAMTAKGGDIYTKEKFLDYKLHIEFRTPIPKEGEKGQHRGNSGVYLSSKYEIQVLDSYKIDPPTKGDCGAVYNHRPPDANMCKAPMEWQTYDITFRAPRFDSAGKKTENARVSVVWNGRVVHDNYEISGPTRSGDKVELVGPQPLRLQDHGHPVQFRNIWIETIQ